MTREAAVAAIEQAISERRGRRRGDEIAFLCPAHDDRTPSAYWNAKKGAWHCFACLAGGGWMHLANLLGLGTIPAGPPRWNESRKRSDTARPLPPRREIEALWDTCRGVTEDDEAARWLHEGRNLNPARIEERYLARVLPRGGRLPAWARSRAGRWTESSHRLVVPTYDMSGAIVSLQARALGDAEQKALWPSGYRSAGVMADPLARILLTTGEAPDWWDDRRVIIAEGIPDFLTWAIQYGDAEDVPAVFGIMSGSWTSEIALRIPNGCRVLVRTHDDKAGHRYAAAIADSLRRRSEVRVPRVSS